MPQQVLAAFMRSPISALTNEFRGLGHRNIPPAIDVEHARQNNAANRLALSDQPGEIVAKPGETARRLCWPLCRQPIEAGGHMGTMAAAEPSNSAFGGIQRGPQRIFSVDMVAQAERNDISCEACCGFYKAAKVAGWHNGVDCRDYCRRADESVRHNLEARVGRRRRAHNQVEFEISDMVAEPLPAIIARVVDNDGQSPDSNSPEAIKR